MQERKTKRHEKQKHENKRRKTRFTVKLWKNILSRFSVQRWTKTTQFSCGMYRFIALLSVVTREWNKAIDLRMMNNKPNYNSNNNNDRPTDRLMKFSKKMYTIKETRINTLIYIGISQFPNSINHHTKNYGYFIYSY